MKNGNIQHQKITWGRISKSVPLKKYWSTQRKKEILSLAGSWQDLDNEIFKELTVQLHKRRKLSDRRNRR